MISGEKTAGKRDKKQLYEMLAGSGVWEEVLKFLRTGLEHCGILT